MPAKYTIKHFNNQFPDDDVCLDYIFRYKYPNLKGYYRVKGRKCYANSKGKHLYPLVGTIFENSPTSLRLWFYSMFLFSCSKNGVSACELERQLGITYKTAWRIANRIRSLMKQDGKMLSGIVEVDETYWGGRRKQALVKTNKSAIMGMVERGGRIRVNQIPERYDHIILKNLKKYVKDGSRIMTDDFSAYKKAGRMGYLRHSVKHAKGRYGWKDIHTNTIEGYWSLLKRSLHSSYHSVSAKYLQSYLDESVFQYRRQHAFVFASLLKRMVK